MVGILSFLSVLRGVQSEVCVDWESFGFLVQVLGVGVSCAAGDCSQGCVLDCL